MAFLLVAVFLFAIYPFYIVLYRLFSHPLSKFPGPKIAASTKWYEFYFEVLKKPGGQFFQRVGQMHDTYGPIVRINPDELHIRDPEFFDILYAPNPTIRHKYPPATEMAGVPLGTQGTVDHHVHKGRRMANSRMFSKRAVTSAQHIMRRHLDGLVSHFKKNHDSMEILELQSTVLSYTTDVIYDYMFDIQSGYQYDPVAAHDWKRSIQALAQATPFSKQFPWLNSRLLMLPYWLQQSVLTRLQPDLAGLMRAHKLVRDVVSAYIENRDSKEELHSMTDTKPETRPQTIFHSIDQSNLPRHEKSSQRMIQEGITILAAGSETTARVVAHTIFHLLDNPGVLSKVKEELSEVTNDLEQLPDVKMLEALPWLTASIRESLRLRAALTSRLPLVLEKDLPYKDWVIPARTPISMCLPDVLHDDEIFPEAMKFKPGRWFNATEQQNRMYVPFGRGTRMCIGLEFAYVEIYLSLSSILRRFDLELYDTNYERDVRFTRDCFIGETDPGSPGIRVKVVADKMRGKVEG